MRAKFIVRSGARAGLSVVVDKPYATIGRHPHSDVRFGPDSDLEVSSRHAAVLSRDGLFVLRDLGSTNGTYVNGSKLRADHVLVDKDSIQLGARGPTIEFSIISQEMKRVSPTIADGTAPEAVPITLPGAPPTPRPPVGIAAHSTGVRAEVRRQTVGLRRAVAALGVLVVVLAGGYVWRSEQAERQTATERLQLLSQVDSLLGALRAMSANTMTMRSTLDSAESEMARLRREISTEEGGTRALVPLRRELQTAAKRQQDLVSAATLDPQGLLKEEGDAIALVLVEFANGHRFTGTGFAIQTDATSGLIVTSRHLVRAADGTAPTKLGAVFNGSNQNFRAQVVAEHQTADVALVRVTVDRGVPVVKGLAIDPLKVGDPVVILGFPLGLDLPMGGDWRKVGVTATTTLGTTARVLSSLIQLDGYGAQGASGSPVFGRDGRVAAVLSGGEQESNGRIVYAVPSKFVQDLLDQVANAPPAEK